MAFFLLTTTSGAKSQSSLDSILITLDLIYGGTFVLAGYLRVAYRFYFRVLNGRWPHARIFRYWLAVLVFIAASAFWMPVGAFWIFRDARSYLRTHINSRLVRICLLVPIFLILAVGGWAVVGARSFIEKRRRGRT